MDKLKFFIVPNSYINYLQKWETKTRGFSRVPNLNYGNDRKQKFVCGVVLNINNINYFAPITSYKAQKADNFLIFNSNGNKVLSSIRFNYMFPVPKEIISLYRFETITDIKYRMLVYQEYRYCLSHQDDIRKLAYRTYKKVLLGKDKGLVHNSCDFQLLEQKCIEYSKNKNYEQNKSLSDKIKSAQQKANEINQNREYQNPKRNKEQEK